MRGLRVRALEVRALETGPGAYASGWDNRPGGRLGGGGWMAAVGAGALC